VHLLIITKIAQCRLLCGHLYRTGLYLKNKKKCRKIKIGINVPQGDVPIFS